MIWPIAVIIYTNRTSFSALTPFAPLLPSLCNNIISCAWEKGVYGWYLSADFTLDGLRPHLAYHYLEHALGRMVRIKLHGSTQWEGMVYEVTAELPGCTLTRSMADMANSVYVEYSDNDTGAQEASSAASDTDSQDKYGVKEFYVPGGTMTSTGAAAQAARYLTDHQDPPVTREITDRPPGTAKVRVHCEGYYVTLGWQFYTSTTAGTQDSATTIGDIATAEAAFLSTTQDLDATGIVVQRRFAQRATAWEQVISLCAQGTDNGLRYFLGVKEDRVLTGWEEPITLSYVKHPTRPGQWFDATGGYPLRYWQVQPGKWAEVILTSWDNRTTDRSNPQAMIIGSCMYDGVARAVRPSYGIKLPPFPRPSAKQTQTVENPLNRPWTYDEYKEGQRAIFYQGKWVTQTTRKFRYTHDIGPWARWKMRPWEYPYEEWPT